MNNVITAYLSLNNRQFYTKLNQAERKALKFSNKLNSVGKNLFFGASIPIGLLGASFVEAGRKAEETDNKFKAVFGSMESEASRVAKTLTGTTNKSLQELRTELSATADLLTGFGVDEQTALKNSSVVSQLAADLSSFNNLDADETFRKLQKGVLGYTAGLTELGIKVDVAAIKQEALKQGITNYDKLGGSVKAATKAQLILNLALDQTRKAQGDVVRSQGSLTFEFNKLKSTFADLSADFGKEIVPVITSITKGVNSIVTSFSNLSSPMKRAVLIGAGIVAIVPPLLIGVASLIKAWTTVSAKIRIATDNVRQLQIETSKAGGAAQVTGRNYGKNFSGGFRGATVGVGLAVASMIGGELLSGSEGIGGQVGNVLGSGIFQGVIAFLPTLAGSLGSITSVISVATLGWGALAVAVGAVGYAIYDYFNNQYVDNTREIIEDTSDSLKKLSEDYEKAGKEKDKYFFDDSSKELLASIKKLKAEQNELIKSRNKLVNDFNNSDGALSFGFSDGSNLTDIKKLKVAIDETAGAIKGFENQLTKATISSNEFVRSELSEFFEKYKDIKIDIEIANKGTQEGVKKLTQVNKLIEETQIKIDELKSKDVSNSIDVINLQKLQTQLGSFTDFRNRIIKFNENIGSSFDKLSKKAEQTKLAEKLAEGLEELKSKFETQLDAVELNLKVGLISDSEANKSRIDREIEYLKSVYEKNPSKAIEVQLTALVTEKKSIQADENLSSKRDDTLSALNSLETPTLKTAEIDDNDGLAEILAKKKTALDDYYNSYKQHYDNLAQIREGATEQDAQAIEFEQTNIQTKLALIDQERTKKAEALEELKVQENKKRELAQATGQVLSQVGGIINSAIKINADDSGFVKFTKGLIKNAIATIPSLVALAIAKDSALTGGFAAPLTLAIIGSALAGVAAVIPKFEQGGLVFGRTFAEVGEGADISRNNPEVIAPLNKLKDFIGAGNSTPVVMDVVIKGEDINLTQRRYEERQNSF